MPDKNFVIGTAGHIDHGKTVLVRALTGRDTDRLAEEKLRGISIDLGFAPFELEDGTVAGIVDVPGHENFIRNMMAGATGVDLALLVVAADDSVMPQTREHLAILDLLGVSRGIVVITKSDLVDAEMLELVEDEVSELLEGTGLEGSPVVAVSGVTGGGIEELKKLLNEAAADVGLKDEKLPARMPIDRVFTLKGIGTVVTGTMWSGSLKNGDRLELLPQGREVRVRSIEVHGSERETASAGEKSDVSRGDVLSAPGYLRPTYMLDASISLLESAPRPLRRGSRVRFHHGTREVLGRVYPIGADTIRPGETVPSQMRLESVVVVAPGDRFVIRSYSPVTTIGGGTIIDAHPAKHKPRESEEVLRELDALEQSDPRDPVSIALERAGRPLSAAGLVLQTGMPPEFVDAGIKTLVAGGDVLTFRGQATEYLSKKAYDDLVSRVTSLLEEFHRENPLADGIARETLKKKLIGGWGTREADMLMEKLQEDGAIESDGNKAHLPGRGASVTSEQEKMVEDILDRIGATPFSPPALAELAAELGAGRKTVADLLALAERDGEVVRVSPDLYFSPAAMRDIESALRAKLDEDSEITVREFRDLIGTSRKYALPLLEYFDRERLTVRQGDVRRLR
jgi:selenocysteine-specific elongation factor